MPLTDLSIRRTKAADRAYKLADSNGLYLLVQPNGSRLWRHKFRFAGKEKSLAYGQYPEVGLAEARERCATGGQQRSRSSAREASA